MVFSRRLDEIMIIKRGLNAKYANRRIYPFGHDVAKKVLKFAPFASFAIFAFKRFWFLRKPLHDSSFSCDFTGFVA
jgi:hypothetical protein